MSAAARAQSGALPEAEVSKICPDYAVVQNVQDCQFLSDCQKTPFWPLFLRLTEHRLCARFQRCDQCMNGTSNKLQQHKT